MAWFKCLIRGENFPGHLLGQRKPVGFYTTRIVEAQSAEEAETKTLSLLKKEKKLKVPKILRRSDARVYFEEITELDRRPLRKAIGFTFFTEQYA